MRQLRPPCAFATGKSAGQDPRLYDPVFSEPEKLPKTPKNVQFCSSCMHVFGNLRPRAQRCQLRLSQVPKTSRVFSGNASDCRCASGCPLRARNGAYENNWRNGNGSLARRLKAARTMTEGNLARRLRTACTMTEAGPHNDREQSCLTAGKTSALALVSQTNATQVR